MQSGTLHWHLWDSHCWEIFAAHYLSPSAGTSLCVARDHLLCTTEVARGKSNYHSKITSSNWKNLDRISLSWILFPLRNDVLLCMVDPHMTFSALGQQGRRIFWVLVFDLWFYGLAFFQVGPFWCLIVTLMVALVAAAAVIWYVCASDMGIRIPVRASHDLLWSCWG